MSLDSEVSTKREVWPPGKPFLNSFLAFVVFGLIIWNAQFTQQYLEKNCLLLLQIQSMIIPIFIAVTVFLLTSKDFVGWLRKDQSSPQNEVARKIIVTLRLTLCSYFLSFVLLLGYYIFVIGFRDIIYPFNCFQVILTMMCAWTFYCYLQTFNIVFAIINIALITANVKNVNDLFKK